MIHTISNYNVSDIEKVVFPDGKLLIADTIYYKQFPHEKLQRFMHKNGLYILPTTELIEFLKDHIGSKKAIDICAGNGALGRALGIPITDIKLQEIPMIKLIYDNLQQPLIKYPNDVERLSYKEAYDKYLPEAVVCSYATHLDFDNTSNGSPYGINYAWLINNVTTLIHIGNLTIHSSNPDLKKPHTEYKGDFIITRSMDQTANRIFVWTK